MDKIRNFIYDEDYTTVIQSRIDALSGDYAVHLSDLDEMIAKNDILWASVVEIMPDALSIHDVIENEETREVINEILKNVRAIKTMKEEWKVYHALDRETEKLLDDEWEDYEG